jgi:rod shape-determining protein MreD
VGVLVFALAILQMSVTSGLLAPSGGPDLLVVLVVTLALVRSVELAAVAGFAGGFLLDAALVQRLGVTSLLYLLAALAAARAGRRWERPGPARAVGLAVAGAVLVQAGYALLAVLLGDGYPVTFVWRDAVLPATVQTAVAAVVLVPLLFRAFAPRQSTDVPRVAAA